MKVVTIHVKPNASREEVLEIGTDEYEVRTKQPPTRGRANKDCVKLLARHLGLRHSQLMLTHGEGSNIKQILVME